MLDKINFKEKKLCKKDFKEKYDPLISELVVLQQKAKSNGIGLVVLFEGWNGAGKGSRISDLMYNLDARSTHVYVPADLDFSTLNEFSGLEMGVSGYFPYMEEFWKNLGSRGDISFFDRGWYNSAVQHAVFEIYGKDVPLDELSYREQKRIHNMLFGKSNSATKKIYNKYIESAKNFEKQLVADGYIVVKFFLHMTKEEQARRLTKLYSNSRTRYRMNQDKLSNISNYDDMYVFYDKMLDMSESKDAPWILLNAEDKRLCNLQIATTLVDSINAKLNAPVDKDAEAAAKKAKENSASTVTTASTKDLSPEQLKEQEEATLKANKKIANVQHSFAPKKSSFKIVDSCPSLKKVKYDLVLDPEKYRKERKIEQKRFKVLEQEMYRRRIPLMILYEGWDAAGKGGNIKRLAQALDARAYNIFTSPAPSKVELAHPHLWRYWTRLPKAGHVGIYDRSWYGRVLVERVEGFATPAQWARAYDEINEFEHDLEKWGAILIKFWVDISRDEQLNRFNLRAQNPQKSWKLTDEDWRNRDKYPQYYSAVEDMFRLTSTKYSPWIILESDDKKYARIKALKIVNDALEKRLKN